jgi:hypothetical protein
MAIRINSAYRVMKIMESASKLVSEPTIEVWQKILNISNDDELSSAYKVLEKLNLLRAEIIAISEGMKRVNIDTNTYERAIKSVEGVLRPQILYQNWANIRGALSHDVLNLLNICSQLLPDEEEMISEDDLNTIKSGIENFRNSLSKSEYSSDVKVFVVNQLKLIEEALSNYHIIGVKAFSTAYYKAYVDLIKDASKLQNDDGKRAIDKIKGVWKKIVETSDKANKYQHLLSNGIKLLEMGKDIFI